jgi:hypothetical protein
MSLSLSDILTRVKYIYTSVLRDTELTAAILERMNYLVSLDVFPFQESYDSTTLAANDYRLATPDNFAILKSLTIWQADFKSQLTIISPVSFENLYPMPTDNTVGIPSHACIKVAEGEIWFNRPADIDYTIRLIYHKIPDDATDTTVSQLTELAKICLVKWAAADGFRMDSEHDRAKALEEEGDKFFKALERRYALAREEEGKFISFREAHIRRRRS